MTNPLHGQRILVTRPAHQAQGQAERLRALGADPVLLPCLEIQPVDEGTPEYLRAKCCVLDLDLYHSVIFVSANAARLGAEWIDQYWPQLPLRINWLAIGQRTAETLADHGITAFHSTAGYDSEALLESNLLHDVSGEKILIMRGADGREKLAVTLRERGARVDYADLYRRRCPRYSDSELQQALLPTPDAVLATSGEGLDNLSSLAAQWLQPLQSAQLVVPSQRIALKAEQLGWRQVRVAQGPDDRAMIQALAPDLDLDSDS
ncbi:uroporphyrinogen-III synthase [Marinobacterium arenosum]|uniref:uroporphyrinogen-III synthase n=1 Tax=Marinobacterium arenosum TaxID=2862496 RepID=UPI001C965BD5|nr:uroporphyrinogen-III synthase [Marinobacterium arenosum]MBY4676909.1 uroporphyrinogen-III synthase [Marinobacterium arenosum]